MQKQSYDVSNSIGDSNDLSWIRRYAKYYRIKIIKKELQVKISEDPVLEAILVLFIITIVGLMLAM